MKRYRYLLLMLLDMMMLAAPWHTFGQGGPIDALDIGALSRANISGATYFFDIPFNIKGTIPDNCYKIVFSYDVKGKRAFTSANGGVLKDWVCFPGSTDYWYKKQSDDKFLVHCDGLHPNLDYLFTFKVYRNVIFDATAKADLQKAIGQQMIAFFNDPGMTDFGPTELNALSGRLRSAFQAKFVSLFPGQQLLVKKSDVTDRSETAYTFDVTSTLLRPTFEAFLANCKAINVIQGRLGTVGNMKKNFDDAFRPRARGIGQFVTDLGSPEVTISTPVSEYLKQALCPSAPDLKEYTVLQALDLLQQACDDITVFDKLFKGDLKIVDGHFQPVILAAVDLQSVELMSSLVDLLMKDKITYTDSRKVIHHINGLVAPFQHLLRLVSDNLNSLDQQKKLQVANISNIPDVTLQAVALESVTADASLQADVTTDQTPYLSVEGGLGYSPYFNKGFSFYGANIYLYPVNKKAELSSFPLAYRWRKRLCINIGISTFFGDRPLNTTSAISGSADLCVGLGYRLNRMLKVNADYLIFNTSNFNTLTGSPHASGAFVVSLGVDVNILKGITDVGKALKILN